MAVINILSPHVADLIAAGEVVERPASVVKELMENAFDAGAHTVICEIRGGGTTYIRVTDDGCGMEPEDAGIAFLRHATSKLSDEEGLASISTMGFRGEALAAISSVSRMELTTRKRGSEEGTYLLITGGEIEEMTRCGCPEGTSMICRDLFYHTPARLKFLKSDRSEASACVAAAMRCALGRPEISVRMIRDGKEEFFSPGDGKAESCVYALLGREEAAGMLTCRSSNDAFALEGFVSSPAEGRGNRAHQFFYVNGRYIRSSLLQSAVEQAYRNTLLIGRYPSCVLYLRVAYGNVDVNVHPAKTEIRFGNEKAVFDFVYQAVKLALESEDRLAPQTELKKADDKSSFISQTENTEISRNEQKNSFYQSMTAEEFRRKDSGRTNGQTVLHSSEKPYQTQFSLDLYSGNRPKTESTASAVADAPGTKNIQTARVVERPVQIVDKPQQVDYQILGEAFHTYIILEQNNELILIDKHAAHERMIFDMLKTQEHELPTQLLLIPAVIRLSPEDAAALEENGTLLTELGFEIEPYGEREYVVRGVPAEMNIADISGAVEEICENLRNNRDVDPAAMRDEVLHTVACKAAIKAGWDTSVAEEEKIAEAVLSGKIRYCPHGRPVSAVITHQDLDKLFKRIV